MRVLFICSGNRGISPAVHSQADSLSKMGIDIDVFSLKGKGMVGYLKAIPCLKSKIRKFNPHIIHAHYSWCGMIAGISTKLPVVTSLMGSDVKSSSVLRVLIRFFVSNLWDATVVKSQDMKANLGIESVLVIPNGVNLDLFKPMDKGSCRDKLGWDKSRKIVLFAADPGRHEKNFSLAESAMEELNDTASEMKVVYGIPHLQMPLYLNAADLLILTSMWEGSPNIVKEAMACNLPIVSTKVGDVEWLLGEIQGHFITNQSPAEISKSINKALDFTSSTSGRQRLMDLGLDSVNIAEKLIQVYTRVLCP